MAEGMPESYLPGIVVTHADGVPSIERCELRLKEFCSLGTAVIARDIQIGESRGLSNYVTAGRPLVGINRLGRTFAQIIGVGKLGKDVLKVRNGGHRSRRVSQVGVHEFRKLGPVGKVVAA